MRASCYVFLHNRVLQRKAGKDALTTLYSSLPPPHLTVFRRRRSHQGGQEQAHVASGEGDTRHLCRLQVALASGLLGVRGWGAAF